MPTLISIIVPCYNEEDNIDRTYAELKSETAKLTDYAFEFIFTDNHSTDGTFAKLARLAKDDPSVRVARFSRNFGFHKSVLTGYRLARGAAAIQVDADLQDSPSVFAAFLEKWREGYDVVVGVRRTRIEPRLVQNLRKMHYRLLVRLDGPHLIPDAGDFRLIDQSIIQALRRIDDSHPYLRGLISSLARNQTGIPYDRAERLHGESKFPIRNLVNMGVNGILTHSRAPLKLAFYTGIIVASASMLLTFYLIISRIFSNSAWPAGLATTQILILFGIGLNALFLGILGVYLGRIYDQVRTRPTTIIAQTINFDDMSKGPAALDFWPHIKAADELDRTGLSS